MEEVAWWQCGKIGWAAVVKWQAKEMEERGGEREGERSMCGCGRRRKRASMSDNIMFQFRNTMRRLGACKKRYIARWDKLQMMLSKENARG